MINHYEYAKDIALIRHNGSKMIDTSLTALAAKAYVDAHSEPPVPPITLKTFSEATEEELVAMVQAADDGLIDLYEDAGWRVGQEREVSLSAISSSGTGWSVGESQPAQTATLVLMHKGDYELVTPVKAKGGASRSTCSFVVGMKSCMATKGYIHSSSNASAAKTWFSTNRANWCEGGFVEALPTDVRSLFKRFSYKTYSYNDTDVITKDALFIFPAEYEVFGQSTYSQTDEASTLFQFDWYKTAENRYKKVSGENISWWLRSPSFSAGFFVYVGRFNGDPNPDICYETYGISPFGCV